MCTRPQKLGIVAELQFTRQMLVPIKAANTVHK